MLSVGERLTLIANDVDELHDFPSFDKVSESFGEAYDKAMTFNSKKRPIGNTHFSKDCVTSPRPRLTTVNES